MRTLLYSRKAVKSFQKLHPEDQKRTKKRLEKLQQDPPPKNLDIRKLNGTESSYRLRVGDVRILFQVEKDEDKIYVFKISDHGEA